MGRCKRDKKVRHTFNEGDMCHHMIKSCFDLLFNLLPFTIITSKIDQNIFISKLHMAGHLQAIREEKLSNFFAPSLLNLHF